MGAVKELRDRIDQNQRVAEALSCYSIYWVFSRKLLGINGGQHRRYYSHDIQHDE